MLAVVGVSLAGTITGPTLSLSESSPFEYISGSTLYYAPTGTNSGSFTVTATASSDAVGGLDNVAFPSVFGSDSATDTSSPYSQTYNWTSSSSASGAKSVVATDADASSKTTDFTVTADTAGPTGGAVALSGGPWFATSVPLTITTGTDTGAGVDSTKVVVERASATLTSGSCGAFGTFAAVTLVGSADTGITGGNCYRYQYKATDNVGNVSTASAASTDAKVDSTPPTTPSLYFSGLTHTSGNGTVLYYPPTGSGSFTVAAVSTDNESGLASFAFSNAPGFTVTGTGASRTFSFSGGQTALSGPLTVVATNGAGLSSAAASFTLVPDSTPPTLAVTCNGKPCLSSAYKKAVAVTITAADVGGSAIDTVRYTTDGKDPTTEAGTEYTRPFTVTTLTRLKVRAYDKVGNPSKVVSVTIRSLADRLLFAAPVQVKIGVKAKFLEARVSCSARAVVTAVLRGSRLAKPVRWRFVLGSGTSIVQFRLPKNLARPGRYTVSWTVQAGGRP